MEREIIAVDGIEHPKLAPYSRLTEAQLRSATGLFIAESPKVIMLALEAGLQPVSLLCESKHIEGDAAPILARCPQLKVFTGERRVLASLTGYELTRGVLCAMRRPQQPTPDEILASAGRVAILDGVCDTTNVGAIFRSATALGIDGVLLTPTACDPLSRRVVRVSMGTVFKMPWSRIADPVSLSRYNFKTIALALTPNSISITDAALKKEPRLALMLGTEGDGLSASAIAGADYTVRIPMTREVDSLNVAAAAAIAFWELRNY